VNISVFGLGYVGYICLGCFAKNGHKVIGVDINKTKVDFINRGKTLVYEKDIDKIIQEQRGFGNVSVTNNAYDAVLKSDVSLICVGTPSTQNGHLNLNAIYNVSEQIAKAISDKITFHVVVIRSTVLPGTSEKVSVIIEKFSTRKNGIDFAVISNPEFLREGSAVQDFNTPPYTLVGGTHTPAIQKIKEMYSHIKAPFIITDNRTAEVLKFVSNAYHALKIIFANEVGNICKGLGIDSQKLMDIFCMDDKLNISSKYLKPGFSYGGSCLPKDLKALRTIAHDLYIECPVLENIERSNEVQKKIVLEKIIEFGKNRIGFIGISFKEGTDDLRNSPIIDIIEKLIGKGYEIFIYDQNVRISHLLGANKEYIIGKIPYISKLIEENIALLLQKSEVIVLVNHDIEFYKIAKGIPEAKTVYDLVDIRDKAIIKNYTGISW